MAKQTIKMKLRGKNNVRIAQTTSKVNNGKRKA